MAFVGQRITSSVSVSVGLSGSLSDALSFIGTAPTQVALFAGDDTSQIASDLAVLFDDASYNGTAPYTKTLTVSGRQYDVLPDPAVVFAVGDSISFRTVDDAGAVYTFNFGQAVALPVTVDLSGLAVDGTGIHNSTIGAVVSGNNGRPIDLYEWLGSDGIPLDGEQEPTLLIDLLEGEMNDGEALQARVTVGGGQYLSDAFQAVFPQPTILQQPSLPVTMPTGADLVISLGEADFGTTQIATFTIGGVDRRGDLVGVVLPAALNVTTGAVVLIVEYTASGKTTVSDTITGNVIASTITPNVQLFMPNLLEGNKSTDFPKWAQMLDVTNWTSTGGNVTAVVARVFYDGVEVTEDTRVEAGQVPRWLLEVSDDVGGFASFEINDQAAQVLFDVSLNEAGDLIAFVNDAYGENQPIEVTVGISNQADLVQNTSRGALVAGPVAMDAPVLTATPDAIDGGVLSVADLVALSSSGPLAQNASVVRDGIELNQPYTISLPGDDGLTFVPRVNLDDGTVSIDVEGDGLLIEAGVAAKEFASNGAFMAATMPEGVDTFTAAARLTRPTGIDENNVFRQANTNLKLDVRDDGQVFLRVEDSAGAILYRANTASGAIPAGSQLSSIVWHFTCETGQTASSEFYINRTLVTMETVQAAAINGNGEINNNGSLGILARDSGATNFTGTFSEVVFETGRLVPVSTFDVDGSPVDLSGETFDIRIGGAEQTAADLNAGQNVGGAGSFTLTADIDAGAGRIFSEV